MSSKIFDDSDDERDSFDVERRQIEIFRRHCLFASSESSEDDDEGIIDGSKVPSSSKVRSRARHSFLDISTFSSSSSLISVEEEENPFDIISKSIDIQTVKKKKKTLGVRQARIVPDVYEQDETNNEKTKVIRSETTERVRKPTKTDVLETERKMQQLSRSEQLILPKFVPKPLENLQELEKRSRKELLNEIRAKNPSFTPDDSATPEAASSVASTLADLTKLIEEKPVTKLDKLSRFLNAEILNKKPTMSNVTKQSNTMIDLTETKKTSNPPTVKSHIHISDATKSPSSTKKLAEMQKQLGLRMREKRAAMLAENISNIQVHDDDEEISNDDDKSSESDTDTHSLVSEALSTMENEQDVLTLDEDAQDFISDEDEIVTEEKSDPIPSDPNRPSLKTILTRMESMSESIEPSTTSDTNGQTEWFASSRPAAFDENLELLCSGAFGGDNAIPPSQNFAHPEPLPFSPLPTTQIDDDDDDDFVEKKTIRSKVRQIIDEEAEDEGSSEPVNSGSTIEEEENEELIDYKKQLFEMEAEESGSDDDEKKPNDDDEEEDSDDNEEADEELAKFIDTAAVEMDEDEVDNIAKVHMKMKAKEDEHQLKLLKEQYLDFDGDDDGRRIQITKGRGNDDEEEEDDPDYNSEIEEDDDDDEEEEEDPFNFKDRISELERQRSMQDNQAEELHLDEDLDHIGQHSSMFQKGLALKQKKNQSAVQPVTGESTNSISKNDPKMNNKSNGTRSVTLSSVLLAQRFSSTLLAPINKNNLVLPHNSTTGNETNLANKKQLNPRRHVFAPNENQNPSSSSGEKRANSAEKSPTTKIKRFKQSTTANNTKSKEASSSVFSALALSTTRH